MSRLVASGFATAIALAMSFAGQAVVLTLEVAAYSNTCSTVFAKAWIDQIVIENAVDPVTC